RLITLSFHSRFHVLRGVVDARQVQRRTLRIVDEIDAVHAIETKGLISQIRPEMTDRRILNDSINRIANIRQNTIGQSRPTAVAVITPELVQRFFRLARKLEFDLP